MLYRIVATGLRMVFCTFYRWRVRGLPNVPGQGGCVVVANHCNFADPLVLGSALLSRRIVRFMAKAEIFKWPVLGQLVRWLYAFPVRRQIADRQAIHTALELVRQGHVLGMFPEGARHRDGRLHELRGGAAMIHLATGAPVVPVGIAGTERMKLFHFPRVAVFVGQMLVLPKTEGLSEREAIVAVNAAIGEGLETCWAKARGLASRTASRGSIS